MGNSQVIPSFIRSTGGHLASDFTKQKDQVTAPSTLAPSTPSTSGDTPTNNRLNGNNGPLTIHRPTLLNAEDRAKQMKRKSLLGG